MKKLAFSFGLLFLFSALIFIACSKDQSSTSSTAAKTTATTQNVSFYLTDDPSFYDSVFVDIKSVSILVDTCAKDSSEHRYFDNNTDKDYGDWVSLSMTPGQYNIRALSNGVDTLLAFRNSLTYRKNQGNQNNIGYRLHRQLPNLKRNNALPAFWKQGQRDDHDSAIG